jgi:AmiR/NasT family two-component response regulator
VDEAFLERALKIADSLQHVNDPVASEAATALVEAVSEIKGLEIKSAHRTLLGQATGIVMEREQVGSTTAFMSLVRISNNTNRKVYDIARQLVETGHLADLEGASAGMAPQ